MQTTYNARLTIRGTYRKKNYHTSFVINIDTITNKYVMDNVKKYCLDYDTFGSEELIDDSKWKDKYLLSDEEIERSKDRIRQATSTQNLFKFLPSSSLQ